MVRIRISAQRLGLTLAVLALLAVGIVVLSSRMLPRAALAAPTVTTDKLDYFDNETVTISGSGFAASTNYDVPVIRPDGTIVKGDGSFAAGWDTVLTNGSGAFTYLYKLNGTQGTYEVRVYPSPWGGDRAEAPLASTTFTDADIDFTQCRNDSDNNDVTDNCEWSTGAINQNNSYYIEGNAVPQRLIHKIDSAGTHTMRFDYEFSQADAYAYDFLTNVDGTMPIGPSGLNECANVPSFVGGTCASLFSGAALAAVPSDPFDAVSSRETPAARKFRVGCSPACSGAVTVSFPSLDGGDDPGEAHLPDSDPDCFKNCGSSNVRIDVTFTTSSANTVVGVWFGGHLAQAADPDPANSPPDGWGTGCDSKGCGASSISGAPFHLKYISLDGGSVGGRDNQIQIGAVVAPTATPTYTYTPTPITPTPTYTPTPTPITPTPTNTPVTPTATPTTPTLTTTASGPVTVGDKIHDTAHLGGLVNPDGTAKITFNLYSNDACTMLVSTSDSAAVMGNGDYVSADYTTVNAGTYYWTASFPGDANNKSVSTACKDGGETSVVEKAQPTISTTPSAGGVIGVTLNDAATLSGGYSPTGTVTFELFPPSDPTCSGAAVYTDADATAPYATSPGFVTNAVGVWHWTADYAGDLNNNPASSICSAEAVTVDKASPTISTTPSAGGVIGVTLNDAATLSGGYSPTGTVTFELFPPSDPTCSGAAVYTDADATAPYATSPGFVTNAVGVWHWTADYAGDLNNNPASSICSAEAVTVDKASPTISTTPSAGGVIGVTLNDAATLSGGYSPTGTVTFELFPPSDPTCSGAAVYTDADATAPYATSPGFVTNAVGVWHWTAAYAGDLNNNPASSICSAEAVTVDKASPTISTTPSAGGVIGVALNDTATLSGGYSPTGTVTFKLFPPSDPTCSGAAVYTDADATAPYATSPGFVSNAVGVWHWTADYAGDLNNNPASSACAAEAVTVTKASPTISTTPSAGGVIGVTLNDTATLSGGYSPTGTVTFKLFPPSDPACSGAAVYTDADATAPYATSPGFVTNAVGVWHWTAAYAGDLNNNPASSICSAEAVTLEKATPVLTTTAMAGPVTVGSNINDTAHLSGGFGTLSGTITFHVFAPGDSTCSTPIAVPPAATVSGAGDYTSGNYTTSAVGTYRWIAHYSGDANNNIVDTACNDTGESSTVIPAVEMDKDVDPSTPGVDSLANLWLCEGTTCTLNGEGELVIEEWVFSANDPDGLGAYEFQLKFDHKIFDIVIEDAGFLGSTGRTVDCTMTIITENDIRFGCLSSGSMPGPTGNGVLAFIHVTPEADLKYRLTPGQENGLVRTLLDENCELTDVYGDPLADSQGNLLPGILSGGLVAVCTDATITVRILEADLNLDCEVDIVDDQMIAYRYGAVFGNGPYEPWYDLEPALKDFDIDIKDIQKVFGRNGSTCQAPIPEQSPMPAPP